MGTCPAYARTVRAYARTVVAPHLARLELNYEYELILVCAVVRTHTRANSLYAHTCELECGMGDGGELLLYGKIEYLLPTAKG